MKKLLIVLMACFGAVSAAEYSGADLTGNFELAASIGRTYASKVKNTFFDVGEPIGILSVDPITLKRINDFSVKYKSGMLFALEANYYFPEVRVGLELSRSKNKIKEITISNQPIVFSHSGYTTATSLMANMYMDFFRQERTNLFVGLGLGCSKIKTKISADSGPGADYISNSSSKTKPAGQVILGAKYWVQENYSVFAYAKHFRSLSKVAAIGKTFKTNSFGIGMSMVI